VLKDGNPIVTEMAAKQRCSLVILTGSMYIHGAPKHAVPVTATHRESEAPRKPSKGGSIVRFNPAEKKQILFVLCS
jgi:hypothetical protein